MDAKTEELLLRSEHLLEQSRACALQSAQLGLRLHDCLRESDLIIARAMQYLRAVDDRLIAGKFVKLAIHKPANRLD